MQLNLRQIQGAFARALLNPDASVPGSLIGPDGSRALRRFDIYRNNVAVSLIDALQANFPVCTKLVGEEFFRAMAREYMLTEVPRTPILSEYGTSFPRFISRFPPALKVPYLADVADVEVAWMESYHAADAGSLRSVNSDLDEIGLLQARVEFHPSVRFVGSEFPVGTIWLGHQVDPAIPPSEWISERIMVVRTDAEVTLHMLDPGQLSFAQALSSGANVEEAAMRAIARFSAFDTGTALVRLLQAGAFTKLQLNGSNESLAS